MQHANLQPKQVVDRRHPAGVAAGEVVVHGHQVYPASGERVQIKGQGGDQCLAFTCAHLGDPANVQGHPADHLDVIMTHAKGAFAGFTHRGKRFRQQVIKGFTVCQALFELSSFGSEGFVA